MAKNIPVRITIPPHATRGAGSSAAAQRSAAEQWARDYGSSHGWPNPTVKLEHDGWQAHFSLPVDDM